jgi:hypothetical protein
LILLPVVRKVIVSDAVALVNCTALPLGGSITNPLVGKARVQEDIGVLCLGIDVMSFRNLCPDSSGLPGR